MNAHVALGLGCGFCNACGCFFGDGSRLLMGMMAAMAYSVFDSKASLG